MSLASLLSPVLRPPGVRSRSWSPMMMFSAGEQGSVGDVQDLLSMLQDSAGTTAAAVDAAVGLRMDKRLGLVRGAEMAAATYASVATFDNTTTPTSASSFTQGAGTTSGRSFLVLTTVAGQWYEVLCTIDLVTAGTVQMTARANATGTGSALAGTASLTAGQARLLFQATGAASSILWATASAAAAVNVSAITVKSLAGNHAVQATAGSRPLLKQEASGVYNLLLDGDDSLASSTGGGATTGFLYCSAVTVSAGAGTARTLWSDAGTNAGYRVRVNATNQLELAAGNGVAFTAIATVATLPVGETHLVTAWDDGTNLKVQIDSGAIASVARPVVSAGTAGFTVGKDNGAATSFLTGRLYSHIALGRAPSATEIARAQRWVAARAALSI